MGGAACAKEILCNPPAVARAENKRRLAEVAAENDERLKRAKLQGLEEIGKLVAVGSLPGHQAQLYHNVCAVLDNDKKFDAAYSALRESLIVAG